jgi:hypothetical protein
MYISLSPEADIKKVKEAKNPFGIKGKNDMG